MSYPIPEIQQAIQLVGPNELVLNKAKKVFTPGPHQILARVEAVGLCFSDLKLLKQFSTHARKTRILSGIEQAVLDEIPSYVPVDASTVPGHEVVVEIWAVGDAVRDFQPGQRYLVQTDYRWLATANSNGAFGYNFEGALQEYVLMDERVITSPEGESMLIPVSESCSAAAVALVEPWACVEDAYSVKERTTLKTGGKMLVVADRDVETDLFQRFLDRFGRPAELTWAGEIPPHRIPDIPIRHIEDFSRLDAEAAFDDVIYFGCDPLQAEKLMPMVAVHGLLNMVLCSGKFDRPVITQVGRVHYGGIRIIGTTGCDPADSMKTIPANGEIRPGNKINIIGAGGPMGAMHVIRNICQRIPDVSVYAGDLDGQRLGILNKIAEPLAHSNNIEYHPYNPVSEKPNGQFDYIVLMVPVPKLLAESIRNSATGAIINIFAGIPADVSSEMDLQRYIEKRMYFIGTSGSTLEDMKVVLAKVESGQLDTNLSVAAVSGLDGAVEGIRAVEKQLIPGKIIVYPACKGLGLIRLEELPEKLPEVAELLKDEVWTKEAEKKMFESFNAK